MSFALGSPPDCFAHNPLGRRGVPGVGFPAGPNAIAHPDQPLNIPLPVIGGQRLPYVEPFFEVHDDHAHAITADVFPLVTAPFIQRFGIRAAYVLPALGFVGILAGCAWLGTALDRRRNAAAAIAIAGLATPFLFYGLELWEHAPAVALATCATAMFVVSRTRRNGIRAGALAAGSGAVFGAALLMRPEMACAMGAVLVASIWLEIRPGTVGCWLLSPSSGRRSRWLRSRLTPSCTLVAWCRHMSAQTQAWSRPAGWPNAFTLRESGGCPRVGRQRVRRDWRASGALRLWPCWRSCRFLRGSSEGGAASCGSSAS